VVLAVQVRPVVARRVDRQIDAMALAPTHVVDLHLPVQVLPVHPVRIVTVHLQVAAPQVVATHPIAAHTQVDHRLHVVIHRVQVRAQIPIAANAVTVHATRDQVQIVQQVVHTAIAILARLHVQVQIVHPVLTVTDQSVVIIVVHQVIAQQVVRMVIAIHAQVPVHLPIVVTDQQVVRMVIAILAQVLTDQQVVHTVTEIPVRHRVHLLIGENVVTAHVIHDHLQIVPIVRHVLMVIDQNAVMIVVQVPIDQQVVRMVIAIPVQVPVHLPIVVIVQLVVHTETATRVHLQIVVRRVIDQPVAHTETEIPVQVPIVHAEKTHTVAIVHAQAMIAMPVRRRVTANAVAVQIVPEVVSPMIAKNVHAVALAKSA
jgi:hypothetical protein